MGSERVRAKNLRLLNGAPLISYAIRTVMRSRMVERFVVNTEADEIARVAAEYGIGVYRRRAELASSSTCTDDIVIDFLDANPCDAVVLVNPTAPFLKPETIDAAVRQFVDRRPSSLFSVSLMRKHGFFRGKPINFDPCGKSPRTQDLEPVALINFIICVFDARHALESHRKTGSFLYSGEIDFMPMDDDQSVDIDYEIDFRMAEALLAKSAPPRFHAAAGVTA
jgi:CMP-N-acetylneuraminic acid synthetase